MPKPNEKKQALSLYLSKSIVGRLRAEAERSRRKVSAQAELILDQQLPNDKGNP